MSIPYYSIFKNQNNANSSTKKTKQFPNNFFADTDSDEEMEEVTKTKPPLCSNCNRSEENGIHLHYQVNETNVAQYSKVFGKSLQIGPLCNSCYKKYNAFSKPVSKKSTESLFSIPESDEEVDSQDDESEETNSNKDTVTSKIIDDSASEEEVTKYVDKKQTSSSIKPITPSSNNCVKCDKSYSKTSFKFGSKVQEKNRQRYVTIFGDSLKMGNLCDSCYMKWYHKVKSEPEKYGNLIQTSSRKKKKEKQTKTESKQAKKTQDSMEDENSDEEVEMSIKEQKAPLKNIIEIDSPSESEESQENEQVQPTQQTTVQEQVDWKKSETVTPEDEAQFGDMTKWNHPVKLSDAKNAKEYGHWSKVLAIYEDRKAVANAKLHTPIQQGINGYNEQAACSVVASSCAGYDDEDYGEVMLYTGQGGDERTDQTLTKYNLSLTFNIKKKIPVRVIRGYQLPSKYAPTNGYRYDGLYWVTAYWSEKQPAGNKIFKFRMVRFTGLPAIPENPKFNSKLKKPEFQRKSSGNYSNPSRPLQRSSKSEDSIIDNNDDDEQENQLPEEQIDFYEVDDYIKPNIWQSTEECDLVEFQHDTKFYSFPLNIFPEDVHDMQHTQIQQTNLTKLKQALQKRKLVEQNKTEEAVKVEDEKPLPELPTHYLLESITPIRVKNVKLENYLPANAKDITVESFVKELLKTSKTIWNRFTPEQQQELLRRRNETIQMVQTLKTNT